ncbi:MAG TPA: trypsin-like peptidase domain-containing protein [Ilumatobacteraceae bacterium]|nr:trypsin-like peptidase domain-containing protein [Ilumatobacteraceae bacterium]
MPSSLPPPGAGDPFVPMPPPTPAPWPVEKQHRFREPTRRRSFLWVLALFVGAWCVGLLGVYVGARIESNNRPTSYRFSSQPVTTGGPRDASFDKRLDVAAVTSALRPSVVSVSSDISESGFNGEGVGTGVVLTSDGQILTNAHVVEGANDVRVRLDTEREPRPAKIVATDTTNDLAILQVDVTGLTPATFADPANVRVGDDVVAIGFALDLDGEASVTLGIISALDRTMITDNGALDGLIQTDAAISSGNSGGPLVNAAGQVVGINTAVARGDATNTANNIGFAISVSQVLPEVEVLRAKAEGEDRQSGFLGVVLGDRTDGGRGAIITEVRPDSPADDIGVRTGDVIVEIDGQTIDGSGGVIGAIRDRQPGDKVTVKVERDGKQMTFDVTLVDRPTDG